MTQLNLIDISDIMYVIKLNANYKRVCRCQFHFDQEVDRSLYRIYKHCITTQPAASDTARAFLLCDCTCHVLSGPSVLTEANRRFK